MEPPANLTADSLFFNGAFNDLDAMQILTEHAVALQQWSCCNRRTLAETYFLSPAEATQFIRDMTSHECGPWSFIQSYDVVHMLWLNESDLRWIAVMFVARAMEIWLETAIGAIRRTVVLNICQGRCCWPRDRQWTIRVAMSERCFDVANQTIITWSSLMAPIAVCVFYCHSKLVWTNLVGHAT